MGIGILIMVDRSLAVSGNPRHEEGTRCFEIKFLSFIRPSKEVVILRANSASSDTVRRALFLSFILDEQFAASHKKTLRSANVQLSIIESSRSTPGVDQLLG
jgi:hypothetical protein